jgi:hypothetical protein
VDILEDLILDQDLLEDLILDQDLLEDFKDQRTGKISMTVTFHTHTKVLKDRQGDLKK